MKKSTFLVVLIAALLGGAVWYIESYRPKVAPPKEDAPRALFKFKQDDVASLAIERAAGAFALERGKSEWRVVRPLDAPADSAVVGQLLNSLVFASIHRTFPNTPDNRKEFGMESPGVSLDVKLKSGEAHRLRFGARDFSGSYVYVAVDSAAEIAVVPVDLVTATDQPLLEFRDRRIAVFDRDAVVRLRLKNSRFVLLAEKDEKGKWLVAQPAASKGKEADVSRLFATLENTRATDILDAPDAAVRARLAHPDVEVELTFKSGEKTSFVISVTKDDAYVRSSASAVVFKVAKTIHDALNFKPADVIKSEQPPADKK